MNEIKQEIISIRRVAGTIDGKIISYLKSTPLALEEDFSELVMATLKKHWLPLALLSSGVGDERLRQNCIWAIGELEAQISCIRRICGIENDPVAINSLIKPQITVTTSSENASILGDMSQTGQLNTDEDEEWMQMEIPEELKQANQMLGWNG